MCNELILYTPHIFAISMAARQGHALCIYLSIVNKWVTNRRTYDLGLVPPKQAMGLSYSKTRPLVMSWLDVHRVRVITSV